MSFIETYPLQHSTILRIYSERDVIDNSPDYQRHGSVWTLEKKQLLIDSILNDYDIPKIYFHQYSREESIKSNINFSIIDGKQRLETIWEFIDEKFGLSQDFVLQNSPDTYMSGMTYGDIAKQHPKIKIKFDSFVLPIIAVVTDDIELIEDMFSRLNEAVPLNSAEKRNAFGGDMVKAIRQVSKHPFFTSKVRFKNNRYQHLEVAARIILSEISIKENGKLIDTKKVHLDNMTRNYSSGHKKFIKEIVDKIIFNLNFMNTLFHNSDVLLRSQGNIVVYYLFSKHIFKEECNIGRVEFEEFENKVKKNRKAAEMQYEDADFELLEYERLTQQGTNDASNIRERLRILIDYML